MLAFNYHFSSYLRSGILFTLAMHIQAVANPVTGSLGVSEKLMCFPHPTTSSACRFRFLFPFRVYSGAN